VIDPRWAPVIEGGSLVDEILPFPREQFRGPAGAARGFGWMLRQRERRPDLCIDLQGLLRSALIARAARALRVIGLSDAREGARLLYHESAGVSQVRHAVDRYLRVLPLLGIPIPATPEFPLGSGTPVDEIATPFILLHPFARGAGKSLSAAHVTELCRLLPDRRIVIAGLGEAPAHLPPNAIDLAGATSLSQLIWLIRQATAVISVDSGPMHIAAAAGAPLLSIHTWSDPRKVGPYSESAWILQGGELRPQRLDTPPKPERPLTPRDLDAIAEWVRGQATT